MKKSTKRLFGWLKGLDAKILLITLVTVISVLFFVELASLVETNRTQTLDERAILSLRTAQDHSDPLGPRWFEEAVRDISALGSSLILGLFILFVCSYLLLVKRYRTALFVFVATSGGFVLSHSLKVFFARPRPDLVSHGTHIMTYSFPSGHSMLSAVVFLTLGGLLAQQVAHRRLKGFFIITAMLLSCLVGLSRIYLGVHYPTDVLAGWCAGLFWATFCALVARVLSLRERDKEGASSQTISDHSNNFVQT